MSTYLYIAQIILGIALTVVILLRVRTSGLGSRLRRRRRPSTARDGELRKPF